MRGRAPFSLTPFASPAGCGIKAISRLSRPRRSPKPLGEAAHDDLATKADLAGLKAELKADIAEVKTDILKWVVGTIGFQTVVILGALVSLVRISAK
jgi:hypothetical protein